MASLSLNQVVSRTAKWSFSLLLTFLCSQSTETIQGTVDASISPFPLGGTSVDPGNDKPRFQDSLSSSFPCCELLIRGKLAKNGVSFIQRSIFQIQCAFARVNVFECIRKLGIK